MASFVSHFTRVKAPSGGSTQFRRLTKTQLLDTSAVSRTCTCAYARMYCALLAPQKVSLSARFRGFLAVDCKSALDRRQPPFHVGKPPLDVGVAVLRRAELQAMSEFRSFPAKRWTRRSIGVACPRTHSTVPQGSGGSPWSSSARPRHGRPSQPRLVDPQPQRNVT
jgi:hypothetical protein